jgi:hypothetical protein
MARANLERVERDTAQRHRRRGQAAKQTEAIPKEDEAEHDRLRHVTGERHSSDRGEDAQEPLAPLTRDGVEKESDVTESKRHVGQRGHDPSHDHTKMKPTSLLEELQRQTAAADGGPRQGRGLE